MMKNKINLILLIITFTLLTNITLGRVNAYFVDDSLTVAESGTIETSYMMLNLSYTSNNMEYLTGVTENIPSLYSTFSYNSKWGLYTGVNYSSYFNTLEQTYDLEIDAGFQKYFNDFFDMDIYYSWHKFKGDTLLEGINYNHSLNLSAGLDLSDWYLSSDISYMLGNTNNFFLDVNFSRFIIINEIFSKKDYFMISPAVSLSFGTDYWLYEGMLDADKTLLVNNLKTAGYSSDEFSYEGFDFFLPVSYAYNSVAFTFSYMYRIPGNKYKELGWENKSAFMLSLAWLLNFKK